MSYRIDNKVCLENEEPRLDIVEKVSGTAKYTTERPLRVSVGML